MTVVPTREQLLPYVADCECHDVAPWVARNFAGLRVDSGFYVHPVTGQPADHSWCVTAAGTIVDTTHTQFVASRPIVIAPPGSRIGRRYHSYEQHHPQSDPGHCLHEKLGVPYACSVATDVPGSSCTYLGATADERTIGARMREQTRLLADPARTAPGR